MPLYLVIRVHSHASSHDDRAARCFTKESYGWSCRIIFVGDRRRDTQRKVQRSKDLPKIWRVKDRYIQLTIRVFLSFNNFDLKNAATTNG